MKKAIVLFLFFHLSVFCQNTENELHRIVISNYKNFIGSSLSSVKSFWAEKISSIYIKEREGDEIKQCYIMYGDAGTADFFAAFKNNKCIEFSLTIYIKEASIITTKLKNSGYIYNSKYDAWENKTIKVFCSFSKLGAATCQLMDVTFGKDDESSVMAEPVIKEKKAEFKDANSYYYRGVSKNESKNYKGAIIDFTKALNLDPRYNLAFNSRGFSKLALGDYKGAIEDYTKSIELNPTDEVVFYDRGTCKVKLKDYNGAIEDFTKVIELSQNDADTYYQRGNCKYYLGYKNSACMDWIKAKELGATNADDKINNNCK
jgi:tetratricopeptide (TPR) repeat protein